MVQSFQSSGEGRPGNVQDKIQTIKAKAEDAASTAAHEGAKAVRAAGEKAEDALSATRRFVEEQPLVAIGVVAVFACALGALWKLSPGRRSNGLMDRVSEYVEPGYQALRRRL